MKRFWLHVFLQLTMLVSAGSPLAAQPTAPEPITAANVGSLQLQATIPQSGGQSIDVNWSPDGRTLAIATPRGAHTFDLLQPTDKPTIIYEPSKWIGCVDFAPDRSVVLSCDAASVAVTLWDRLSGEKLATVVVGRGAAAHARFSPDGKFLAVVTNHEQALYLWGVNGGADAITAANASNIREIKVLDTGVFSGAFSFSADSTLLATDSRDGLLQIWDMTTLELKSQQTAAVTYKGTPVYSLAFSPDAQTVVMGIYGDERYFLVLVNAADTNLTQNLSVVMDAPNDVAFSPDGKLIASGHNDGLINIWNAEDGRLLHTLETEGGVAFKLAFNRDGTLLATLNFDLGVRVWGIGDALALIPKPVLTVGSNAVVTLITTGDVLNMRAEAGTNAALLVQLRDKTRVAVVDGPLVVDGLTWWKVRNANRVEGWVAESVDGEQTLTPDG